MKEEKSLLYTLILGVCILLSLLLIGKMLLYRPAPVHVPHMAQTEPEEERNAMYLSENNITALLTKQLPEGFPVQAPTITILKDGTITAAGQLEKEMLSEAGFPRAVLLMLPNEFPIEAVFVAQYENGNLTLTPTQIRASGFELPVDQVPKEWVTILNEAVNRALQTEYGEYSDLRFLNGGIQLLKESKKPAE